MNFKSYSFQVIARILLLAAAMMAFFFALNQEKWYVTTAVSGCLIPVFIFSLIQYVHRFRMELSTFLTAIKNKEYNQYQRWNISNRSYSLSCAFSVISRELQDVRIEKEQHYHYLQAIVGNINTAIISCKASGEIHLFNKSASDLLNIQAIKNFKALEKVHPDLYYVMKILKPGEKRVVDVSLKQGMVKLAVQMKEFKQQEETYRLFALQDIRSELDSQELASYQKLIRVLRHEIMNSATPISSLSEAVYETALDLLNHPDPSGEEFLEELEDLKVSTQTIHTRTKGLLKFIQNYRKLTNIPPSSPETFELKELVDHTLRLLYQNMDSEQIQIKNMVQKMLQVYVDFDQMQQVVINVVLNALQAIPETAKGELNLAGKMVNEDFVILTISDNGIGIKPEDLNKIFIPFYTTKDQGAGIGLSLARQLMKLNNGDIRIDSKPGNGTTCKLWFPVSSSIPKNIDLTKAMYNGKI